MNYLISIAMLFSLLAPQNQKLPDEFYQLPEDVRAQATVVLTGTYAQGRSPCILRPDGTRMWLLEAWFNVTKVYQGKAGGKSIYINKAMLPKSEYVEAKLEAGRNYLVLLRPGEESLKVIRKGEYAPVWDALRDEEIVAVVELR